ncbi:hypothetical protein CO2235_30042 [Cupriavidus oxalaticus]|uniref:Uncharacterized protein n=1 Tax=Cupriavidus oxalaticus TaxID=96344 RepID=A0A976BE49_9BURK|nr:hypothetical protein CO2235_30042 [Cupriavidus oxalaticus]
MPESDSRRLVLAPASLVAGPGGLAGCCFFFPAGMTEKPTIIMAALGLAQAKTGVFVKIVAANRLPEQREPLR